MEEGYVKLWRKMRFSQVMSDKGLSQLWLWCMVRANWKEGIFKGIVIPVGSFVCDMRGAAEELKEPKSTIAWRFKKLEILGQIRLSTSKNLGRAFTVVTLCNWRTYQCREVEPLDRPWTQNGNSLDRPWTDLGRIEEEKNLRSTERSEEQERSFDPDSERLLFFDLDPEPKAAKVKRLYLEAFETFWANYPRKVAKHKASAAYLAAVKRLPQTGVAYPEEYLLDRVKAFAASETGRGDQQFIPFGSTWLNEARYEDDDQVWNCTQKQQPRAARSFD